MNFKLHCGTQHSILRLPQGTQTRSSVLLTQAKKRPFVPHQRNFRNVLCSKIFIQGAVVCPSSAEDISATILFARAHSLDLAVCGGGHSTGGASSTDGGVVIDLSNMRRVTVDPKSKTIKAQGGCLWEEVDAAGGRYGLATVGGTVNHTGVGGLTLGGGYGWLSGKYGLVIDNLLAVQLVLANGRIVTASASENPDLFWAARGAGASFGVAVEFTFQAFDQKNPIWAGILGFPAEKIDTVVSFANQVAERSHGECGMIVGITAPPPKHVSAIFTSVFYNGSEENGKAFFRPLLDAGPVLDTTSVIPYSSLNAILNPRLSHGNRKTTKGATFATPLSPKFVHRIVDEHSDLIRQLPEAAGTVVLMEFFATSKICEVPLSAMSFANRGEHQNVVIIPRWLDSKHDNLCREWARRLAALYTEEMERMKREDGIVMKVEGVGEYGNYDSGFHTCFR